MNFAIFDFEIAQSIQYIPYLTVLMTAVLILIIALQIDIYKKDIKDKKHLNKERFRKIFYVIDKITQKFPLSIIKGIIREPFEFTSINANENRIIINSILMVVVISIVAIAVLFDGYSSIWYTKILIFVLAVFFPIVILTFAMDIYRNSINRKIPKMIDNFRISFVKHKKILSAFKETAKRTEGNIGKIIERLSNDAYIDNALLELKKRFNNVWLNIFVVLIINYKDNGGELIGQLHRLNVTISRNISIQVKKDKRLLMYELFAILAIIIAIPLIFITNQKVLGDEGLIDIRNNIITSKLIISSIVAIVIIRTLRTIGGTKTSKYIISKSKDTLSKWERFSNLKLTKKLFNKLENNENFLNNFIKNTIKKSEIFMSIRTMYIMKILSVVFILLLYLSVEYTNIGIQKMEILKNGFYSTIALFDESQGKKDIEYNTYLYYKILQDVGEQNMQNLSDVERLSITQKILKKLEPKQSELLNKNMAIGFVKMYKSFQTFRVWDTKILFVLIFAFFIPELFLRTRRIIKSSTYEGEVIKLENIVELLGNSTKFKTVDILREMEAGAEVYKRHISECRNSFGTNKELALITLRDSVNNIKFQDLIDVLITYSTARKDIALEILNRNMREKEENALLIASEDVDRDDIIAMFSVMPILYYIMQLILQPVVKIVLQSFEQI